MSSTRIFAVAIRSAPNQLWPTFSHHTPIFCFHTTNNSFDRGALLVRPLSFDRGALHIRPLSFDRRALHVRPLLFDCGNCRTRWVHTSRQPDETIKKTEEKNEGGEAERKKTEEKKKQGNVNSRQELKKLVALENEMEGLEKLETEVRENLTKETMYFDKLVRESICFDKLVREWVWKIKGIKRGQELEKEFDERLEKLAENWEGVQKELTESLERIKAVGVLKNERDEVRRKVRVKKDERDKALHLLISSYRDVLSSPPIP